MTREEIIKRQNEITEEIKKLDLINGNNKVFKHFKALCIENSNLQRELDKLEGRTYNSEKWITKYSAEGDSYKEARLNLVNKIKDLPGVEVNETDGGVTTIRVYTEYKIYTYTIHAHNYMREIHTGRFEKTMFGDEQEVIEYKHYILATIDKDDPIYWSWRY